MKTTSLKMLIAVALSISAVSAVNAAPAVFKIPSTIAYDQGGNDPFPTSAPEVRDSGTQVLVYHEGGSDPFPISSPDVATETPQAIAYDQGGNDPFPTSAPEARDSNATILANHEGGTDPFPPSADVIA